MSFDWIAQFAATEGNAPIPAEGGGIAHFGDLSRELAEARDGTIVAPLAHFGLIACSGEDAAGFLHNQLTSDVNHLEPGHAQHSAWCTAKGRMLASFLICRTDEGFLLQLDSDLLPSVLKRLQMFVLRARVRLSDASGERALIGIAGASAVAVLGRAGLEVPQADLETAPFSGGTLLRLSATRFEIVADRGAVASLWQRLASLATPVGVNAWKWLEVEAGIPVITAATREEFVPQMANFDQIGGVSFHKGCYPGQEVVARTQYLGKVKRHLYRVAAGAEMSPGMPIYVGQGGEQPICGQIVNAAPAPDGGNVALAVLQENAAGGEMRLRSPDGPPVTAAIPVAAAMTDAR